MTAKEMVEQARTKLPKVYLAGKMRGVPLFNFPAFTAAAEKLRGWGYEVWSPHERDIKEDGFDPVKDKPRLIKEYMEHDLAAICRCDAVVLLPGWETSRGASLEVHVARQIGLTIYALEERSLRLVVDEPKPMSVLQEADALISGDRQASYGPANQDFKRTADMWTALLQYKLLPGERIRSQDVGYMMILLKASRGQHSNKRDTVVDIAGYAGCIWRCVEEEIKNVKR